MNEIEHIDLGQVSLADGTLSDHLYLFVGSERSFLLSSNGLSLVISNDFVAELTDGHPSDALSRKMVLKGMTSGFRKYNVRAPGNYLPCFFMIDFSTVCNLNCIYCLRELHSSGSIITEEELMPILNWLRDYYFDNGLKVINIQPWGGEPMLSLPLIYRMDDYFRDSGINANITIQTNGTIMNESILNELIRRNIHFGISIDGCRRVQDIQRPAMDSSGTFDAISENIRLIRSKMDHLSTISVNTKEGLNSISESLDELAGLGVTCVKFNLMHPNSSTGAGLVLTEDDISTLINKLVEGLIRINKRGVRMFDANIRDKILNLCTGSCGELCHSDGCTGGYTFVTINRHGDIYPCELVGNESLRIGSIFSDEGLVEQISRSIGTNPYFSEKRSASCEGCPWHTFCRGGCTASVISYCRGADQIDEKECAINRILYPKLVDLILNHPDEIAGLTGSAIQLL